MLKKDQLQHPQPDSEADNDEFPLELAYTTLDYLGNFPNVTGDEAQQLVAEFHVAAENAATNPDINRALYELLNEINPRFNPRVYSEEGKANVLANVVSAVYAPIIHNFNSALLLNIQTGALPHNIIAPPRDTIPFVYSLKTLAEQRRVHVEVLTPYINRHTAGILNNQVHTSPVESPYLRQHLAETILHLPKGQSFTEVEPGIYSTLSLKVSKMIKELGHHNLAALKLYGLGPNLSYIHAILSDGQSWIAEEAEKKRMVDPKEIAELMILLDSIEEFGMQDTFASVQTLVVNGQGKVEPYIVYNGPEAQEIARATNSAVLHTADTYSAHEPELIRSLLSKVPFMAKHSKEFGLPLTLASIIPPDDRHIKEAHFNTIRSSGLLYYPQGLKI